MVTAGSNSTLRFYRKLENQEKRGTQLRSLNQKEERRGNAMIHTSGLLRVTDVIKDLRCGVVTIVTLLVDWRNDYSACSTLTCFRGFLHYDMTRSVLKSS